MFITCGFHENTTTLSDLVKKTLCNHYGFYVMAMYTVFGCGFHE